MAKDDRTTTIHFMALSDQDLEDAAERLLEGFEASAPRRESERARDEARRRVREFVQQLHSVAERNRTRLDLLLAPQSRPH